MTDTLNFNTQTQFGVLPTPPQPPIDQLLPLNSCHSQANMSMVPVIQDWSNCYVNPISEISQPSYVKLLSEVSPPCSPTDSYLQRNKRLKTCDMPSFETKSDVREQNPKTPSKVIDYSDPFAIPNLLEGLDNGKYGSMTKEIEDLIARKMQVLNPYFEMYPTLPHLHSVMEKKRYEDALKPGNHQATNSLHRDVIDLEGQAARTGPPSMLPVVIIDSDDEDKGESRSTSLYQEVFPNKSAARHLMNDLVVRDFANRAGVKEEQVVLPIQIETGKDKGVFVGVEDDIETDEDQSDAEEDGLDDIWKEMSFALESSKDATLDLPTTNEDMKENDEECDHSYVLKDDIGYVCRVCGVIQRGIETIFDFQYVKGTKSSRTAKYERWNKDGDSEPLDRLNLPEHDYSVTELTAHPRHSKEMKPHQVEGFNFLVRNLVAENPGGCILAHAPGSGKTFMLISFIQSFMAKYPHARPLVVLPKGIVPTWRKEFQKWQVEDIPLFDFYNYKADNRAQQLEILKKWVEQRSILFLGYKQFSTIVCGGGANKIATACEQILLKVPTIMILDEGHTPRNDNTDVLQSLAKVQTPRKVVLSGTLYQNHVKEVFNILNLVRPKFLKMETSRDVVRRVMSRVKISGVRKQVKSNEAFFESVEYTLQKDDDFKRKVTVIHDLREMTSKVLHYYKGDFLDELPGLVDFTVLLKLSDIQKMEAHRLKKHERKFKRTAVGSAIFMHPGLKPLSENSRTAGERASVDDEKMDAILEKVDVRDGAKAKFYLNILSLCESAGEKLLVFSQYLLPIKFLERLTVRIKGWSLGREMFSISGDSSPEQRDYAMERFNSSSDAKVFFGSIKACGEGISLVGASRILILDVHLNPSVTRQAIGRAFRPGQKKKVYSYRLVAADSPEEEDHATCFRKELIAKMWFEWNEYCGYHDFEMENVNVEECGDPFLEKPLFGEDIKMLYKR